LVLALVLCTPVERLLVVPADRPSLGAQWARGLAMAALTVLATAMLVGKSYNPFLYYRF
jgi:hypothetical protein